MGLANTPMQRLLASSSTQNSWVLAAGRTLLSSLTAGMGRIGLGGATNRLRTVEIVPFGTTAAAQTFSYRVWRLKHNNPGHGNGRPVSGFLDLLYTGTATLGTGTLVAGDDLLSTGELLVTTLTGAAASSSTSPKGAGAILEAAHNTGVQVLSPGDNTPAKMVIPDCFDADELVIEFNRGSSAATANALVFAYA
jgi:hypothetical protein